MKRRQILTSLAVLPIAFNGVSAESVDQWVIEAPSGEFEFDYEKGLGYATNGVVIKYGDATLTADQATLNQVTGDVEASGAVFLRSGEMLWSGDHLTYNFKTRVIEADTFRAAAPPFYIEGAGLSLDMSNKVYSAENSYVTTDDSSDPFFRVKSKEMTVAPGRYIKARNATLYAGHIPVMYFPYYKRGLNVRPNNFVFKPGYRSLYGPYLLGRYNFTLSENLSGALNLDYRQKRGVGAGPEVRYDFDRFGEGEFKYYYLRDEEPGETPAGRPIGDDRYRIAFDHNVNLRTNLNAKVVVRKQSDAYVVRDFFESEYRDNVQPSSFLEVNQLWPNFTLDVLARPRINTFYETVERLPDVKFSGLRQRLGVSPFYYESESSAGFFRYKYADDARPSYEAFRGDTYHQITLPKTFFGFLNFIPRAGGRFTYYSEAHGRGGVTDEAERWVFNTGAEVNMKASRLWRGASSEFWDVDGLRHIIQPSLNYVFVPNPSKAPRELPQFDSEVPSFRLLPIEYPDYNAIDSIDSRNVLRMGLRNRLQTKRDNRVMDIVHWALYTDWRLNPRADQDTFADVYSDIDFQPRDWLVLTSETRYDIDESRWREANHYLTLQPNDVWSYRIGHRYLYNDLAFGDDYGNNLITSRLYYKMNENWAFRISHQYEARDGNLEEQQYSIYRDLKSWTSALTFRVRNERRRPTDFTVGVSFSLKAFPRYDLGDDKENPSMLLGY
ncbi:MAG: LPS assembly protein LptD [Verrucomicrobia bacterium]|nr:LPS assembly protein LptD [Verrucomicrobiota bacterium]MCF7709206.1 LPS assembly protein LptD [Verrucomicrobiota bacterium]